MLITYYNSGRFTSHLLKACGVFFSHAVPPNIAGTDGSQDFTVLRNRQVTLECKSDAVPPPVITWLKNGEQLQVSLGNFQGFILREKKISCGVIAGVETASFDPPSSFLNFNLGS